MIDRYPPAHREHALAEGGRARSVPRGVRRHFDEMCQAAPGGEMCLCYADDEGVLIWDCDKPPAVVLY